MKLQIIISFVFLFYSCKSFDKLPANIENKLFIQIEQRMLSGLQNHTFFIKDNFIEVYEKNINGDPSTKYERRLKRNISSHNLNTVKEKALKTFNLEKDSFVRFSLSGIVFIVSIKIEDRSKEFYIFNSVPIEIQELFLSINEQIPYRKPHLSYGLFNDTNILDKRSVVK